MPMAQEKKREKKKRQRAQESTKKKKKKKKKEQQDEAHVQVHMGIFVNEEIQNPHLIFFSF